MKFKSSSSQLRVKYDEQLEWPLVNTFPTHIHLDPTAEVTIEDFRKHSPPFTVLPDFWKHWALTLNVERAEFYKLDFNAEG